MSETLEAPLVKNTQDNASVRARMVETVKTNREQAKVTEKKEEPKPEIKAETISQTVEVTNKPEIKADEKGIETKVAEQMAENNAKIEVEKVEAEKTQIQTEAKETEQKLAEATKEKQWFEEEDSTTSASKVEDKTKPEYELKAKQYEELASDPFIEAYTTAKKAGKDITSFIKDIAPLDVDSIPTEKLFELSLQAEGLTEDEKTVEIEQFSNLTPLQKKRAVADFKETMRKKDGEKLAKYVLDNKVDQAKQEQFVQKYQAEKTEFLSKVKEKDFMGLKLTNSDIEQALNYVENGFPALRDDGTYNVPSMFELAIFRNKKKEIMQNALNNGISMGREQALKEFARIDRNDGAGKVLPDVTTKSRSDQAKDLMRKRFGG